MDVAQSVTVRGPQSSTTVWSAPFTNVGGSLTGMIVIVNVCEVEESVPRRSPCLVVMKRDGDRRSTVHV